MTSFIDARIPVVFGNAASAGPEDALLFEGDVAPPGAAAAFQPAAISGHPAGCACCAPRNAAGQALSRLMLARAREEVRFFRRVVVEVISPAGEAAIRVALAKDPVASSCFRLD